MIKLGVGLQFCSGVVWTADRSGVIPARLKTFSLIHVCHVNHTEPFNILRVKNKLCTFISTNQFPRKCNSGIEMATKAIHLLTLRGVATKLIVRSQSCAVKPRLLWRGLAELQCGMN